MEVIQTRNKKDMSKLCFDIVSKEILKNPNLILGLATGSTPLILYKLLNKANRKKKLNFSKIKTFNLDEYYPIQKSDKNSYYYYMFKNLFNKTNIKKKNINLLDGGTKNPKKECENYEKKINKNKIDLQILGVGVNGHIGFNEPDSKQNSKTRLINLSRETIKINKTKHHQALTMGIKTIMSAKKIILLASGENKAEAIKKLVKRKSDENWPVSFLKKHKNLTIIIDKKAGEKIR